MTRRPSVVKSLAWLIGSRFGNLALSLLSTAILARFLTPADFGLMVATTIIVNLANAIFDGAFGLELVRTAVLENDHVQRLLNASLTLGAMLTGLMIAVSPMVQVFYGFEGLALVMMVTAPVIMAKSVFSVCTAMLQQRGRFRSIGLITLVANPVGSLLVSVPLAMAGFGIWALVAGLLASALVETLLAMWAARPPLRLRFATTLLNDLRGEGGMFALSQTLNWAALSGSNIVSGHALGLNALGIYSRGWRLLDIAVSGTAGPMQRVFTPLFATMQTDLVALRRSFIGYHRALSAGFAVLSALICMNAHAIVVVLLGGRWLDTVPIVQILFSALIARSLYKLSEGVILSLGRSRTAVGLQTIYAVLMIGGSALGSRWGAEGVAVAASGAVWAFYFVSFFLAARILGIDAPKALGLHLAPLAWAGATVALEAGLGAIFSPLGFWIATLTAGFLTVFVLAIALILIPPRWLGFDPRTSFIAPLVRKVSASSASGTAANPTEAVTYVYGQVLPNTAANSGAVMELTKALARRGVEMALVRPRGGADDETIRQAYDLGDSVRLHSAPEPVGRSWQVQLFLKALQIKPGGVVVTRMAQVAVLAALVGRPVVLELHQHLDTVRRWWLWRGMLHLRRSGIVVAALTPAIEHRFDTRAVPAVSGFVQIPSGAVDLAGAWPAAEFDVGYIGSFLSGKGLELVAEIAAARPTVRFVVFGDAKTNPSLAHRLSQLDNVTLGGHVARRDLSAALHHFTVGLAPYAVEGFGGTSLPFVTADSLSSLKVVEYMSASRVVVASRIPAVEAAVRDELEALLCRPDILDDWLNAIDRCLADPALARRLSEAGRQRYERDFSMERRADLFINAIRLAKQDEIA